MRFKTKLTTLATAVTFASCAPAPTPPPVVPPIEFANSSRLLLYVQEYATSNYQSLISEVEDSTGIDFVSPPILRVTGSGPYNRSFSARYDKDSDQVVIFVDNHGREQLFMDSFNSNNYTQRDLNNLIEKMVIHESAHGYLHRRADALGVTFWDYGDRSDVEGVKRMWKLLVEGVALGVTNRVSDYPTDLGLVPADSLLDMPLKNRYRYWEEFPYAAGQALVEPILGVDLVRGIDAIVTTVPTEEDWANLRGYREKVLAKLEN